MKTEYIIPKTYRSTINEVYIHSIISTLIPILKDFIPVKMINKIEVRLEAYNVRIEVSILDDFVNVIVELNRKLEIKSGKGIPHESNTIL